ncbi:MULTISPECIES: alpha-amylase family glycosyl hydrolase [unclassified Ruminococcus]|uniref:alpha-amylase family glycosyl hydrolase n=1 Tax=unclassified Ruminococcus TaxID=2608920 RepID=UPI002109BBC5|nr:MULTISPECIES: alpha-amylase family glycosyl hydrolase [unclassified Ruminococcus]MCQ4022525.1 starch-binding protein [Ruminococcus sp. zg-924]MCQ4115131.1 starch-binding protein [Ruminococcus sp. zg-921]
MNRTKKIIALLLSLVLIAGLAVIGTSAVTTDDAESAAADNQIIVHYYQPSGTPTIYYWNSLPENIETTYPGKAMTNDGNGWYSYTFDNVTKINMLFVTNGEQSKELTRSKPGEFWYKNEKWTTYDPEKPIPARDVDMREETIYFVMTTRFYDGDSGNNVHCWEDAKAGNPDSDTPWRGDFQGLIDKLDYIKALGFSAIWITPVVTNGSGYDYHGYHAFDFSTVDVRYESAGATFDDLIDAVHSKGMKLIQDVVWQHTGNFGEANFEPLFDKVYNSVQDLANIETSMIPNERLLSEYGLSSAEEYYAQPGGTQHAQRLKIMKDKIEASNFSQFPDGSDYERFKAGIDYDKQQYDRVSHSDKYNTNNYYHNDYWRNYNWDDYATQYSQIAGDCVDLNTENPEVLNKIVEIYSDYINRGVDAFRVDTLRHMSRLSLNAQVLDQLNTVGGKGFYMFGEACTRYTDVWYRGLVSESAPFYTWDEQDDTYLSKWNYTGTDPDTVGANMNLTLDHWIDNFEPSEQPTSKNAFLNGNDYHEPDYSQASGMSVIDFPMHWNFGNVGSAFKVAKEGDKYYNDATWNVVYVDSHDYGPGTDKRYNGGTDAWAENLSFMFTFRGIPCLYYGSEVEFQKGVIMDVGPNAALSETGRAYFGDYLEGDVTATDFSQYSATGTVADTLSSPLSKHLSRLNQIRRAIPALQKGQYSVGGVSGNLAYKRGYTDSETGEKSFVCVTVTSAATFTGIPNGTYIDAVTGKTTTVTNGTLKIDAPGKGNMRAYVLCDNGYTGIDGKIGEDGVYLK